MPLTLTVPVIVEFIVSVCVTGLLAVRVADLVPLTVTVRLALSVQVGYAVRVKVRVNVSVGVGVSVGVRVVVGVALSRVRVRVSVTETVELVVAVRDRLVDEVTLRLSLREPLCVPCVRDDDNV